MNPRRLLLSLLSAALLCSALLYSIPLIAQTRDVFAGTWLLSRGKSDFDPPSAFFSRTMILTAADGGYSCEIKTISDRHETFESIYTARLDGTDAPFMDARMDTVSLRRIDANTIEQTGKIKGKLVETATMKVSPDGKVLTKITKGSVNGEDYSSTQIFNRQ
jgi:hypothetical protein